LRTLKLLATRPGRSGYQPHSSSTGQTSSTTSLQLHPQRTSDLARGRQATCSSTPRRAANLRPSRGASGPRAAAREVVLRSVSRRGRRRSQGDAPPTSRACRVPSNPLKPWAAVSIKAPSTPHCPQGSTSGHQPAQRPQTYCYTPPAADLRPRTGAQDHVQRHAQACCEPPTLARGLGPTRRSTRSRAAKCEPTGTSALPGGRPSDLARVPRAQ
jgi:hypothetical protein